MKVDKLSELFDYKNQLMEDILTDETLVRLISGEDNVSDPRSLAYDQVFPYQYIPETSQEAKTYVCFEVDVRRVSNELTLAPDISIWVLVHGSQMRLDEGGVRPDAICTRINELINGSRQYGMGELEFTSCKRYAPQIDYHGKVLTFTAREYNRQYDPSVYIPSNRKSKHRG